MKCKTGWAIICMVVLLTTTPMFAGNGAPSGSHYNLNIIGVSNPKTSDMTGSDGHTIFIPLNGNAKIWLCDSALCADGTYQVLDRNGTDNNGATFALPNPDADGDGTTTYSVFARALGKPGGSAKATTCATDTQGTADPSDDEIVCSVITMDLTRKSGKSSFTNVSKYLLYIYADVDGDGILDRVPLFAYGFQSFYWDWYNTGLRLAQLRFYPCSSTVPDPTDPNGSTTSACNP